MSIKILIADDHEAARLGIRYVIDNMKSDIEIVAEATNGRRAVEMVAQLQPDIVIMDIGMPELNGIEAARKIKQDHPRIKIIALTIYRRKPMIVDMLKAGVSGYILKDNISETLPVAIKTIGTDEIYLCPEINRVIAGDYVNGTLPGTRNTAPSDLAPREREILQLLVEGHNTKQAAQYLGLSVKTIESTRSRIMKKLAIYNLAELTKYAIREGVTTFDY
ncbi:MAG: response regulator transcription factor [Deltaproteobacteria bacterium]|nr:response regulator transcription factor [Deltaproteobacteria bacterium]